MTFNLNMSMFKVFDLCFEVGSCNIKKATSFLVYHGKPLIHPNSWTNPKLCLLHVFWL